MVNLDYNSLKVLIHVFFVPLIISNSNFERMKKKTKLNENAITKLFIPKITW
jgi:hypothetical protein